MLMVMDILLWLRRIFSQWFVLHFLVHDDKVLNIVEFE